MSLRLSGFLVAVLLFPAMARAVEPDEILPDKALEARARTLSAELRCLVCQNQSIDDSAAPLARDLRAIVRERLRQGDSDDSIRAFLVSRYGKFVLLKPPLDGSTLLLWGMPLVVLLGAAGLMVRGRSIAEPPLQPLTAEERDRVEAIVAKLGR